MQIGIDYRPALVNQEGIGRATRELIRALTQMNPHDLELKLFAWTLAAPRFDLPMSGSMGVGRVQTFRRRIPARLTRAWLALRAGAPGIMGMQGGLFHHTQPRRLPVGDAVSTTMVWDLLFLDDDGRPGGPFVEKSTAKIMAASVRRAVDESSALLVPTEFVRQEVIDKLGVDAERVHAVGLGCEHLVHTDGFEPATRPPFVLTVCRVEPRKNHLVMLAAFERLVRSGLPHHWLVVGPDGWCAEEFNAALARSPVQHRIQRLKRVPDVELAVLFDTADVFLFASRGEGFGIPPLEAMAAGVPVVAASASCLPEVLGTAAKLVDPDDTEALFEALSHIVCNRDARADLILRGRERAAQHTWQVAAEKHLAVWRSLLEAPARP